MIDFALGSKLFAIAVAVAVAVIVSATVTWDGFWGQLAALAVGILAGLGTHDAVFGTIRLLGIGGRTGRSRT